MTPAGARSSARSRARGSPSPPPSSLSSPASCGSGSSATRDVLASERFRATNVFFANGMELNAGNHSLWRERWKEYEPGARLDVVAGGERFVVEMNSEGYRTHEFEVPKPKGLVRVVCIGGSTTVAGRTNDETYPALLEKKLRARFPGLAARGAEPGRELGDDRVLARAARPGPRVRARRPRAVPGDQRHRVASLPPVREGPPPAAAGPTGACSSSASSRSRWRSSTPTSPPRSRPWGRPRRACHERGVAYLAGSFACPDPARARGEFRRHLDYSAEFWTRWFPMPSYATWAAIVARHNRLFVRLRPAQPRAPRSRPREAHRPRALHRRLPLHPRGHRAPRRRVPPRASPSWWRTPPAYRSWKRSARGLH